MMPPIFESESPFVIKVYDAYFQITWDGAVETPEDNYPYEQIKSIILINGKKKSELPLLELILEYFTHTELARRMEEYDEVLIKFRSGKEETRYIHGKAKPSTNEAIELITEKLKSRKYQQ